MKRFTPVIAILLAIALVGGGVYAAFFMQREVPSTIKVLGHDCEVYQDVACTVPLEQLDYGEIDAGENSAPLTFYIKNVGDYDIYLAMNQTDLDSLLTLYETYDSTDNTVPGDPDKLKLQAGEDVTPSYWQETATTTSLTTDLAVDWTNDMNCSDVSAFPNSGVVKLDDELIAYESKDEGIQTLNTLTRGYDGTTAASHDVSATVTLMEWVEEVSAPTYNLPAGEVRPTTTYIASDPSITRSEKPFSLYIYAQDTEF